MKKKHLHTGRKSIFTREEKASSQSESEKFALEELRYSYNDTYTLFFRAFCAAVRRRNGG